MTLGGSLGSAALGGRIGAAAAAAANGDYSAGGEADIALTKGVRYRWVPGANDASLGNADSAGNAETFTEEAVFIAWSDTVLLTGTPSALITATLAPQTGWERHAGGLLVVDWTKHPFSGERRLFFVGQDGFVNLYEETFVDTVADQYDALTWRYVETELLTRGYTCSEQGWNLAPKRWRRGQVNVRTWAPDFMVETVFDGVSEMVAATINGEKDRTRYMYPFSRARHNPTNINDDHAYEGREDYSVPLPETPSLAIDNTGFNPDLHQETTERFQFRRDGTYCQIRVTNAHGRCVVTGAGVQAVPGPRRQGTLA
jgi:hypothetical protein